MLYLIGLGLADEQDITVKGLEIVKRAERVYLEAYTSILHVGKEKLVRWLSLLSLIRDFKRTQALRATHYAHSADTDNPSNSHDRKHSMAGP
jgi:diphthine synthase